MRRTSLFLALLLAVALVFAGCGGKKKSSSSSGSSSKGSSSIPGAELTPASAVGFVSLSTDAAGAQWQQAKKLFVRTPGARALLDKFVKQWGFSLTEVEAALGPVTDLVELGAQKAPQYVLLSNPADPSQLENLLANASAGKKLVTTRVDSWVAASDSQATLDKFRSDAASGKLADSATFKQALADIPADSLLRAYLTGSAISVTTGTLGGSGTTSNLLKSAAKKNQLEWGALTVSALPEGFSIGGTFKGKTSLANSSLTLLDALPSGTSLAIDLNGKALGLDKAVLKLRNNKQFGSQIPQLEAALGVKLEDLAALLGSEMAVYGTHSGIGILIKAPNAAKSKAMLDKVIRLLGAQLSASSKSVSIGGVQATLLKIGKLSIYYGVKDGDLFLVTDKSALPGAGKLSGDPLYAAAVKTLPIPSENAGVAYVDFAGIAELGKSLSALGVTLGSSSSSSSSGGTGSTASTGSTGSTNLSAKDLAGFSSLLGYIASGGDKVELKGLVTVE